MCREGKRKGRRYRVTEEGKERVRKRNKEGAREWREKGRGR